MKNSLYKLAGVLILCMAHAIVFAQSAENQAGGSSPMPGTENSRAELQQKLGRLSSALVETREQLERSQRQIELLQTELQEIQKQLSVGQDHEPPAVIPILPLLAPSRLR